MLLSLRHKHPLSLDHVQNSQGACRHQPPLFLTFLLVSIRLRGPVLTGISTSRMAISRAPFQELDCFGHPYLVDRLYIWLKGKQLHIASRNIL